MAIQTQNPATGVVVKTFKSDSKAKVSKVLDLAVSAQKSWRKLSFQKRASYLRRVARELQKNKHEYAALITLEMGKPIKNSVSEIEKCALNCNYYAEHAHAMLKDEHITAEFKKSYVAFDPLGVVFAIMPWNFPFWQVFRFAAPALMAGNTAVLKHASNVPQCTLAIEKVFTRAGLPRGVFQSLLIPSSMVEEIVEDNRIAAVTLTGSEEAGREVAEEAGESLKPIVLELGGSDPFIVLKDANLKEAAKMATHSRIMNSGQSCVAAKRFIIEKPVLAKFTELFVKELTSLNIGDPLDPATEIGPLARKDLAETLDRQVKQSVKKGAKILTGGHALTGNGYYYEPTALANVKPGMPAYHEELFGPVAAIISANNAADAIRIANDTKFGLGANLWTKDLKKAEKMAREIESGFVAINGVTRSDPRFPFGGVKASGFGRELGIYGIREFVNIKTIIAK